MSAALSPAPADWQVAEHEPPIEDHAAAAAGHAQNASVHSAAAMGAAQSAHQANAASQLMHQGMTEQMNAFMGQMDAWRQHIEQIAAHAVRMSEEATQRASEMAVMVEVAQRMGASMEVVAHAIMSPRKIVVTQRGADGAITEAMTGPGNAGEQPTPRMQH